MGHNQKHRAEPIAQTNFGLHVYHTVDAETSKFASADCLASGGSRSPPFPAKTGSDHGRAILRQWQYVRDRFFENRTRRSLQPAVFMTGLRCGGPPDFCVDGIVIRSGEPFSNGENWQRVSFSQR